VHVERRIDRYATFFTGFAHHTDRTWYEATFPDRLHPELVLLVHSPARLAQIERLIAQRTRGAELRFGLRAFTVESAATALCSAGGGPNAAAPSSAPGGRVVRIEPELSRRLLDGLDLFIQSYNALQTGAAKHAEQCARYYVPPVPSVELNAFCDRLRHDVLGIPRPPKGKP
jgi:hypothetical protein